MNKREKDNKNKKRKFTRLFAVYVICGGVSLVLIGLSFGVPNNMWAALFSSVGCSGITAALMAIFIDMAQKHSREERVRLLRKVYLSPLFYELQHLMERVIWFDYVIDKIELDKEEDYYLSLDFVPEAFCLNYYEQLSFSEAKKRIEEIVNKCEKKSRDASYLSKEIKMFNIIGKASRKLQQEVSRIAEGHFMLVEKDIFDYDQIAGLLTYVNHFTEFLEVNNSNFQTSFKFLLTGYEKLNEMCNYNSTLYICWHTPADTSEMLLNRRRNEKDKVH